MSEGALSKELGRVLDDYRDGADIEQPLGLCVDLAVSLESELELHRLGDVDAQARMVIEGTAGAVLDIDSGNVIAVEFGSSVKEGRDGRGI